MKLKVDTHLNADWIKHSPGYAEFNKAVFGDAFNENDLDQYFMDLTKSKEFAHFDGQIEDGLNMLGIYAVNDKLRSMKELTDWEDTIVGDVDGIMKPLNQDLKLYCGTNLDRWGSIEVGDTFKDLGYVSTSLDHVTARNNIPDMQFKGLMIIHMKSGQYAAKGDPMQKEIILPRGTTFKLLNENVEADSANPMDVVFVWSVEVLDGII